MQIEKWKKLIKIEKSCSSERLFCCVLIKKLLNFQDSKLKQNHLEDDLRATRVVSRLKGKKDCEKEFYIPSSFLPDY